MERGEKKKYQLIKFSVLIVVLFMLNLISYEYYFKLDLTKEKRHSLRDATKSLLKGLDDEVYIEVYLDGELPSNYKRLRDATEDMLQSFEQYTSHGFNVEFKDPLKGLGAQEKQAQYQELYQKGITPVPIANNEETSSQKKLILPGALINYKGKELVVQILQGEIAISNTQAIENSVSKLEYNFASALRRMNQTKKARLGFIHGHGELEPIEVMDFVKSIANFYDIEPIELPKVTNIPKIFDLVIVAKPQKSFNEFEKFKLDQYIMNGGKMIWLIDGVIAEMDSL